MLAVPVWAAGLPCAAPDSASCSALTGQAWWLASSAPSPLPGSQSNGGTEVICAVTAVFGFGWTSPG